MNTHSITPSRTPSRKLCRHGLGAMLAVACTALTFGCDDGGTGGDALVGDAVVDDALVRDARISDSTVADVGRDPDAARPDSAHPDAARPDSALPDAALPDAAVAVADAARPDAAVVVADAARQDAVVPDAARLDAVLADAQATDAASPDAVLPDAVLPDAVFPDAVLPDAVLPDAAVVAECTQCHGGLDGPAPPRGLAGELTTDTLAVGAHTTHLVGGALRTGIDCVECHVVPDVPGAVGHLDASPFAEVTFGPLATAGGSLPRWDRVTATCSDGWCHGSGLSGGTQTTPVWTVVDGTQAACGTCHGAPPPAPHAQVAQCTFCHPGTVGPDGTLDLAGGRHIDGVVDVGGP